MLYIKRPWGGLFRLSIWMIRFLSKEKKAFTMIFYKRRAGFHIIPMLIPGSCRWKEALQEL